MTHSTSLFIRPATETDLEQVLALWLEAADWTFNAKGIVQWKPGSFRLETIQEHFQRTEMFVAELDGEHIGTFTLQWSDPLFWEGRERESAGYMHKLIVSRAFSGRGIGRLILEQVSRIVRERGKGFLCLDCMAENEGLSRYYLDQGFTYVGRVDKKYFSASLFEKAL